jgi:VacB/RNase II family 3'-5' exoribonuclease
MRLDGAAAAAMRAGIDAIAGQLRLPGAFPPAVEEAAATAAAGARRAAATTHTDRTDLELVTLDPASSTDLDQAFAIERAGGDVVLRYAIADVGAFVRPGDVIDAEAWERGVTVYLPGRRVPLHPAALAEDAASLLPGDDRLAVLLTVRIADDGTAVLDHAERAVVRSRAKLAYESVTPAELPDGFEELARRVMAAEAARGASRVEFPEQELSADDGGFVLQLRPRRWSEEWNAAMSLAANLAVADALVAAGTGLFRVMPPVDERDLRRLRHAARAFGLAWPDDVPLDRFERSLPRDDHRTSAFLLAVRRASGGASYAPFDPERRPWHAAVAATYAHATAPLRRLQDRYVLEATLAVVAGRDVPGDVADAFERLPAAMERAERRAAQADAAALDLAEAVALSGCVGEVFRAVVTDEDQRGVRVQLDDPPVVARVDARRVDPGDEVRVRLVRADPDTRSVVFERVA